MTIGESWRSTNRETWTAQAECRHHDPETFFPPSKSHGREAKAICAVCPVMQECGAYALREKIAAGVYGGMTGRERHELTRTPPVIVAECGTERGASRHYRRHERLYAPCLAAIRERSARSRAVPTVGDSGEPR